MGNEKIIDEVRKIARAYFNNEDYTPTIEGNAGVFVTLKKDGKLRGCIGVVNPTPLKEGLIQATIGALNDPRFMPVKKDEFEKLKIEVSILERPQEIHNIQEIKIGEDGIIIRKDKKLGLLLPQVAVEYGFGIEEFLDAACIKAGIPPKSWKMGGVKLYKFKSVVIE